MNLYSELAPVREDVEKYLLPHEIIDEYPVRLYTGTFEKIPVWVYWHQGFGSAPDIVKLCVASIRKNSGRPFSELEKEPNIKNLTTLEYVQGNVGGEENITNEEILNYTFKIQSENNFTIIGTTQ